MQVTGARVEDARIAPRAALVFQEDRVFVQRAGGDLTESLLTKTEPVDIAGILPLALLDPILARAFPQADFRRCVAAYQSLPVGRKSQ